MNWFLLDQIRGVQGVFPDEVTAGLHNAAHELGEDVVGLIQLGDFYAEQRAHIGIERCFPKLFGVHFAEAGPFYFAEAYHQQYLAKNPHGYCGLGGTGVVCSIGTGVAG